MYCNELALDRTNGRACEAAVTCAATCGYVRCRAANVGVVDEARPPMTNDATHAAGRVRTRRVPL
jgi:hypothetical protein